MGRPQKRKRNSNGYNNHTGKGNKKSRSNNGRPVYGPAKQNFWIMDCEDSEETIDGKSFDIEVLVTRCELSDDFLRVPTNDANVPVSHDGVGIENSESKRSGGDPNPGYNERIKEDTKLDSTKGDKNPLILSIGTHSHGTNVEREGIDNPNGDDESIKEIVRVDLTKEDKKPCILSNVTHGSGANGERDVSGNRNGEKESVHEVLGTDPAKDHKKTQIFSSGTHNHGTNVEREVTGDNEGIKEVVKIDPTEEDKSHHINSVGESVAEEHVKDEAAAPPVQTSTGESNIPTVGIKKSRRAKSPFPRFFFNRELPNGDCGDGITNPFPREEVPDKYWAQRRRLFNRFDEGIQLDKESWYSVTPEVIASHISQRLVGHGKDLVLLDPFCGCGGNSIAFASRPEVKMVVCVDVDVEKLRKAHHNASIYGVENKLLLVLGNAFAVLSRYRDGNLVESQDNHDDDTASLPNTIDIVFLSPPWGGTGYNKVGKHGYDLTCVKIDAGNGAVRDGEFLLQCVGAASGHKPVAYFLPRNINGESFARSALRAGFAGPVVLEQNVVNGKLKTVTAYLGLGSE